MIAMVAAKMPATEASLCVYPSQKDSNPFQQLPYRTDSFSNPFHAYPSPRFLQILLLPSSYAILTALLYAQTFIVNLFSILSLIVTSEVSIDFGMKFGKEFRTHLEKSLPEWRDKFLCYKLLKKLLKRIPTAVDPPADDAPAAVGLADRPDTTLPNLADLQNWFVGILGEELDKFNDFYVDKEEEFVIRLQELKGRIDRLKERSSKDGVFTSEAEFSEEMMDIRKDFVTIHGEMVLLKTYSSLNFAGLIKILKKYDKRTGGLLRLPFTQLAFHQPFFTTEPLTRLVRECEANLELLFPLEEEVIQSSVHEQDPISLTSEQTSSASNEIPPSLGEDAADIYRSTLAAIRTIQGLKKASSTHNPLSLDSVFGNQDTESTGALTDTNSPESLTMLQNGQEVNPDDANSPQ